MNNKTVLYYLRAMLALFALLAFVYLYGRAFVETLRNEIAPVYSEAYVYVATALAGLVGGVAATSLGQTLPTRYTLRRRLNILGNVLAPFQRENFQYILAIAYTVIYILYGIFALFVWVTAQESSQVIILIRDLALIFFGLLLATTQGILGTFDSTPPDMPARRSQPAVKTQAKTKRRR